MKVDKLLSQGKRIVLKERGRPMAQVREVRVRGDMVEFVLACRPECRLVRAAAS